jgi:hypothetical protein
MKKENQSGMFGMFKRTKGKVAAAHRGWTQLAQAIQRRQRRYADWLQAKSLECSPQTLRVWLVIFCLVMAGICSYILYQGLNS